MCARQLQGLAADKPSDARNFPYFPFSSHNYCFSHTHMAMAVHHVLYALHPLLKVCCCLLLRIPASQLHSPPIRVRGRVGGSHRGGATWQPPCPLCGRVGGTTHRLSISVVKVVSRHIAVQLHAAPAAAGQGPMRVECSGLSVILCVVFPCVLWCRQFLGDDTTFH